MNLKIALAGLWLTCLPSFYANAQHKPALAPIMTPKQISKTAIDLYTYNGNYVKLSENFTAYDPASKIISKEQFLQRFATGNYLPLRLVVKTNDKPAYQLYKMSPALLKDYQLVYWQMGQEYYTRYKMEGKALSKFSFTDINGKVYDPKTTKGKIVVLKFWFIACKNCVEEMPELNEMVDQYKGRKDILFVSLAFDAKKDLVNFLKKKKFNYAVVPDKRDYMMKDLKISAYPTHMIINKQGLISKVINTNELVSSIENEISGK